MHRTCITCTAHVPHALHMYHMHLGIDPEGLVTMQGVSQRGIQATVSTWRMSEQRGVGNWARAGEGVQTTGVAMPRLVQVNCQCSALL